MSYHFKTTKDLEKNLETNIDLQKAFKEDPIAALKNVSIGEVPNTKVYWMVVTSLVLTVLVIIIGLIVMVLSDKANTNQTILTIFTAIASTAVGALAGVLVPVQKQA